MADRWRWPHDTPVERARRVARSYRALAHELDPGRCARLDEEMIRLGQRWVVPTPTVYQPDDLLTADLVADYAHVALGTVYEWKRRRGLPWVDTIDGIRFRFWEVQRWLGRRGR